MFWEGKVCVPPLANGAQAVFFWSTFFWDHVCGFRFVFLPNSTTQFTDRSVHCVLRLGARRLCIKRIGPPPNEERGLLDPPSLGVFGSHRPNAGHFPAPLSQSCPPFFDLFCVFIDSAIFPLRCTICFECSLLSNKACLLHWLSPLHKAARWIQAAAAPQR